jgi:HK97 family phage major capsid protein
MARGFVPISIEARQDEANVAQEVGRLLAFGKDVLEAAAFATGTGSGQPTGVVTALVAASAILTSATTDTLAIADIYALQNSVPARFRQNAAYLANNAIYNRIRQFDTSGGGGFWTNLNSERPPLLMGKPALESEDMDGTLTALAENYVAVYGDFSNYVIYDRLGVTVDFIPHLFQQTTAGSGFGRPTGQSGWFAYYRAGATVVNSAAFKVLNVT